ncbi:MAG TPA: plastocyanin/azurin family copper-binding protein [Thermoplasmata archaeon]|nr:plastocyanin/azurin family copper-binding protein [Thermoplasmata archaeon]HEV2429492.1 plastocyanin/azurin family copper-binding protein [Thermoplasmata archaeon]
MPTRPFDVRRLRTLGRRSIAVGLAFLLLGIGLSAQASPVRWVGYAHPEVSGGGGGLGSGSTTLVVNLTDAPSFSPRSLAAIAGASVTFRLHNLGGFNHTFSLSGQANVTLNQSWSPSQLFGYFARNGTSVNASLAPGAWSNVTFSVSPSWSGGRFEFVSLVPYQFQAGMFGFFNVTSGAAGTTFVLSDQTGASDLTFAPDALAVNATSFPVTIEIQVSNLGTTAHTWTVAAQPNVNLTPTGFPSYFAAHPPAANVNVPTTAGVVASAQFTLNGKGVYEFICEVPGHFANGMFGFLYVGVPLPTSAAPPSTAIVEGWVLAAAGSLLGVGVLLAATAAYVGRFPPRSARSHHP